MKTRLSRSFELIAVIGLVGAVFLGCDDSGRIGETNPPSTYPLVALQCVDWINQHRASNGLAPYSRWEEKEGCADEEAESDAGSGQGHGAFGSCGETAQNECPGWTGPPEEMIEVCLQRMWDEGPGPDFSEHGHYLSMASTQYTQVACGFFVKSDGSVWAVQNFR